MTKSKSHKKRYINHNSSATKWWVYSKSLAAARVSNRYISLFDFCCRRRRCCCYLNEQLLPEPAELSKSKLKNTTQHTAMANVDCISFFSLFQAKPSQAEAASKSSQQTGLSTRRDTITEPATAKVQFSMCLCRSVCVCVCVCLYVFFSFCHNFSGRKNSCWLKLFVGLMPQWLKTKQRGSKSASHRVSLSLSLWRPVSVFIKHV